MIKMNRALLIFNFDVCFMPSPPCRLRVPASPARRAQLYIRDKPLAALDPLYRILIQINALQLHAFGQRALGHFRRKARTQPRDLSSADIAASIC